MTLRRRPMMASTDSLAVQASDVSSVDEGVLDDELKIKLARYSLQRVASQLPTGSRVVHDAVMAAIRTPEENDSVADKEEGSAKSVESDGEDSSESSTSSSGDDDDDDDSSSSTQSSENSNDSVDEILDSKQTSGAAGLHTLAEQNSIESPLRMLNDILEGKHRKDAANNSQNNTSPLVESPSTVLNRLLEGETPPSRGSGRGRGKSQETTPPERRSGGGNSNDRVHTAPPLSSGGGASSLTMLHQLQQQQHQQQQQQLVGHIMSPTVNTTNKHATDMVFRLMREIGRGGFGVVFQAILDDGRLAAVKELPITDSKGVGKEMRVMCNLPPHPHCVQYLGVKRTRRHVYMVMEYVSGGSIQALRKRVGRLPESVARRYAHMTLLGLHHLHAHRLLHQDIKGANVLLDERGCAKIADFGCIKDLSGGSSSATTGGDVSTQGGAGTPLWMAPEVCRGEYPSTKSDVWSFGCFFLEMINDTGLPWNFKPGTTLQGAAYAIGSATVPPSFPSYLSSGACSFLRCCLAVRPNERLDVAQLLQHEFFSGGHVSASAAEVDFYRSVQSLVSESTLQTNTNVSQEEFVLEAASDDSSEAEEDGMQLLPIKAVKPETHVDPHVMQEQRQLASKQDSKVIDEATKSQLVWRSRGELRVDHHRRAAPSKVK